MLFFTKFWLILWAAAAIAGVRCAGAADISALPVTGSDGHPALLLELGTAPPSLAGPASGVRVTTGELASQDQGLGTQSGVDEIASLHPGFGHWKLAFRFALKDRPSGQPYTFWARWRQGGEPAVCEQTFELWAGPDAAHLERRGEFRLRPKGWEYAWIAAEPRVNLHPADTILEVRDSGAGHDAKIFDAFLLGPPPPPTTLPVTAGTDKPAVLLELGTTPPWASATPPQSVQVRVGTLTANSGTGGLIEEKDETQVLHAGFGSFGASFRFELKPSIPPGQYRFFARYKSGGEVSQVAQTFTLKAGGDARSLAPRGEFVLTNTTPWEYQWLAGSGTVAILPGDRFLDIENAGKADGAKVFDAFMLQLETPLQGWMTAAEAELRNRFLARVQIVEDPQRRLYVLDGPGAQGGILFKGLASEAARKSYSGLQVKYLIGRQAETMARELNVTIPAALISDDRYSLLGVLAAPKKEAEVARFLADPQRNGKLPAIPTVAAEPSRPLRDGVPEAWLVGGLQDGQAGISIYGVDTEIVLRPNPEQSYFSSEMMGGRMRAWQSVPTDAKGQAVIVDSTDHDYRWSKGSGYGQLYLHVEQITRARLRLKHSGIASAGWLDGNALGVSGDGADLNLTPGWHSLLLKFVMEQPQGQRFAFGARFIGDDEKPLAGIQTRTTDPATDAALNRAAGRLRPLVYADAPANLPRPGESLKIRVDLRWHPLMGEKEPPAPIPRFKAKLRLRIVDYGGKEIATRETDGLFPGIATLDFGKAPGAGYYAAYPSLHTLDGKPIMAYPADGFSVVRGASAQKARLDRKKLWNNYYYAFADGDRGFRQEGGYFTWLERMGIYRSYGSYPGFETKHQKLWDEARKRGLELFADTAGDSHWLNDDPAAGHKYIETVAPYTRYFKASNEIDTRREGEWQKLRDPAHWVQRARGEHDLVHQLRADGHYVGGSLVRPGDLGDNDGFPAGLGPGRWFEEVLKLGLDQYLDAWDVHAYPQRPPRFGGPIGNADTEDERGVLATYARLGKANKLPFWLGEAGAKAAHGFTGRRWQAEQAAKMIAWVNSRADYLGIAFCIAHEYDAGYGRLWDYSMGHKPGEAAIYTAGALIDGLPYKAVDTGDPNIQAAYFGETLMLWRVDEKVGEWSLTLDPKRGWVLVDVVGHAEDLTVPADGNVHITLASSPVYVLSKADYQRLTE